MSASDFSREIGRRIAQELDARDWSHRELARQSGVSQPVISNIVKGAREARAGDLAQIAAALGAPLSSLLPAPSCAQVQRELSRLAFENSVSAGRRIAEIGIEMMANAIKNESA